MKKPLLMQIADLILESDKSSKEWVTVPRLRRLWYLFCCLLIVLGIFPILRNGFLMDALLNSEVVTFWYRISFFCYFVVLESVIIIFTIEYYKYVLSKQAKIYIENILFFYVFSTVIFGFLYGTLWRLYPSMFHYALPPFESSDVTVTNFWGEWKAKFDFLLFSFLHTVGHSFYRIQFNSFFSSLIGWIHAMYNLSLVVLFIASYVNQKFGAQKENDKEDNAEQVASADVK